MRSPRSDRAFGHLTVHEEITLRGITSFRGAKGNAMLYDHLYGERLALLGSTTTIFPLVDPHFSTGTTTSLVRDGSGGSSSGLGTTIVTATEDPEDFDTSFDPEMSMQGIIPYVTLNGTDEAFRTPDLAYYSLIDSGATPGSYIFWINVTASAAVKTLMAKHDAGEAIQEWSVDINAAEKVQYLTRDDSVPQDTTRISDDAITTDLWHHIAVTYSGVGGTDNQNGTLIYVDGAVVASAADNAGNYSEMEDGTSVLSIGARTNGATEVTPYLGKMACGPLGPTIVLANVSAANIHEDYLKGRAALEL